MPSSVSRAISTAATSFANSNLAVVDADSLVESVSNDPGQAGTPVPLPISPIAHLPSFCYLNI